MSADVVEMSLERVLQFVAALVVAVVGLVGWPEEVEACSMPHIDVFGQTREADVAAVGSVVPGGIAVEDAIKGSPGDAVTIPVWVENLVETWRSYLEEHSEADFETGYRERDLSVPSSREELAARVEQGPSFLDRFVAFERCEWEVGRTLYPYSEYRNSNPEKMWKRLAEACRKGMPTSRAP